MRIVYSRSSTATQSLLRQRRILTEAGLLVRTEGVAEGFHPAEGVLLFEDPATTSKTPALERPAFGRIAAAAAHPGDTLTVSELFRLCRDLIDIHAVRDWCRARGVVLRVLSGPLSNFHNLAANDATTALIINVITAVGQFQRDLQNELTAEGIAAAEAEGRYRGRPPALAVAVGRSVVGHGPALCRRSPAWSSPASSGRWGSARPSSARTASSTRPATPPTRCTSCA
ncbi:DNA invertase Pin-like site-specific DNA recombinase [Streptosporangium album]|uniref:DNA invertase Pin-like site-specific DNA recombinase n=1 Tax=Streptosporangium album TaxID=47479 RepID=A0A7W7WEQ7_9ACTN|nr:recombinase family protein [Streptosporangium album]MBB4944098.1 DNA invertase Pin-like site-specific DNA recombinase [Streptosporangium album]